MFENLCTLPLSADALTLALHPSECYMTVGLSSGHVECFRLPPKPRAGSDNSSDDAEESSSIAGSDGKSTIDSIWRTRRHKGSCRSLAYSSDGEAIYSAGSDGILKHFSASDGVVISKMAIPLVRKTIDPPALLHCLNPHKLLLGCDSGALHIIDLRNGFLGERPTRTVFPHEDYVSCIVPLPPTSEAKASHPKQWVSTGGTTIAVTDARSGIIARSEDQDDELLCAVYVPGLGPKKNRSNGVVAVGMASGVLTLWDRGVWDDHHDRVTVDNARGGGESIDAMALLPDQLRLGGKKLAVAVGDGTIRFVDLLRREVMGEDLILRHDDVQSIIVGLGFDADGRLISAGGSSIKVWQLSDLEGQRTESTETAANDLPKGTTSNDTSDSASDDSSDDDKPPRKRPIKAKQSKAGGKRRKLDEYGNHGVLKFEGLE